MGEFTLGVGSDWPFGQGSGQHVVPVGRGSWENAQRGVPAQELNRNPVGDEAVCRNSARRAGAWGGARVSNPRWLSILPITAGSSMAARIVKGPPHCGHVVRSMANTRVSNCAQPAPLDNLPRFVFHVDLKHILRKIDSNRGTLHVDSSFVLIAGPFVFQLGTFDAVLTGGVHTIIPDIRYRESRFVVLSR